MHNYKLVPDPVAPPPIINKSYSVSFCKDANMVLLLGILLDSVVGTEENDEEQF
jgi:hypothetical protein